MCKRLQNWIALTVILAVPAAFAQNGQYVVIEDFEGDEIITLNVMANGPGESPADFQLVENPAPDAVNPSATVMRFRRSHEGDPWAGFWSVLPEPIDMTEMKYVHVHVLKPRISPVRFKVEGGMTDPPAFELESMEPQTVVDEWEHLVFHFENADGAYPTIVFMPDFEDPLDLDEDIFIYFDNIILGDSPEPPAVSNEPDQPLARSMRLDQNYPNPFSFATTIEYHLDQAAHVSLSVYNLLGQQVSVLIDVHQPPGSYSVTWEADRATLPSGLYLYSLEVEGERQTRPMLLVR